MRTLSTAMICGVGNYGVLLWVNTLRAGRGFTIAQLSIVVNALMDIFWLNDPQPDSRAVWVTFISCELAALGGIVLENL